MNAPDRLTLDYVYPRLYQALPKVGDTQALPSAADNPVLRPLVADLLVMHAFDLDTHFQMVAERDLTRLGVTAEEVHERAIENLRALNPQIQAASGERCFMLTAGGNYEATLLLLPEVWNSVQSMVTGTIVAVVPARDVLFFTGDADNENLAEMRRWTSKLIEEADKPLSRAFLRRENERWVEHTGFAA